MYQISSELKELAKEQGISINRRNLINYSRKLAATHGDDYLARRILEQSNDELIIIVGMRQIGQIDYLKTHSSFTLIGVDAEPKIRLNRVQNRKKIGDPMTLETFIEIEKKDDGESVQKISDCMKRVDYTIKNNGDEEELYSNIEYIMKTIKLRQ